MSNTNKQLPNLEKIHKKWVKKYMAEQWDYVIQGSKKEPAFLPAIESAKEYAKVVLKYALEQAEKELPVHLSGNILALEGQIIKDLKL